MGLKKYREKRNFKQTPEPKGVQAPSKNKKLVFVVQKHAARALHYDFRLEAQGVLWSWAVPKGPCLDPKIRRLAVHVEDHPYSYKDFEGVIPKGQYGAGNVLLWDQGEWVPQKNALQSYKKGNLSFELKGKKLKGFWKLVRMQEEKTWLLIKINDQYARPIEDYNITLKLPNSIISNRAINEINEIDSIKLDLPKSQFPKQITPQLATLIAHPPQGKSWLHEIKFDGYRLLAFKKGKTSLLKTRHNLDWSDKFPNIVDEIKKIPINHLILDGEVVVLDHENRSDFQLLQNAIKNKNENFIYYIFDILFYDKYNLMSLPLIERKKILKKFLNFSTTLRFSDHILDDGEAIFNRSCELDLEGIISKKIDEPYLQKRSLNWLKIKCIKRQEFLIAGFTKPKNTRKYFGSLILAIYNDQKELIFSGLCGTGFNEDSLKTLHEKLIKNKIKHCPFLKKPSITHPIWVKPTLVAEINFLEWTKDGLLRHPSFKGLREDKPRKDIVKESAITLTHPQKIVYPENNITKKDLSDYYLNIKDFILPYIINRPLTLLRCPDNYKKCFYQRHLTRQMPNTLYGIEIAKNKPPYLYIKNEQGLLALIQLGVLEIHPWGSTIAHLEYPNLLLFDLDPSIEVPWREVLACAFALKAILKDLELESFVKTTGGKGLHVVVPINPHYSWEEIKNFSHAITNYMSEKNPKHYINKMTKSKRIGKIFIDYLRNQKTATAIAPYSTRAREGAPIATPLDWDELDKNKKRNEYTLNTLPERLAKLKKDPWENLLFLKQKIKLN